MEQPKYQRVLLKISGEALASQAGRGIDFSFARQVCQVVKDCVSHGVQVGLVVGGGNFWRASRMAAATWNGSAPTKWACWPP